MPAKILTFTSRLDQLKQRYARDFARFMTKHGPYTHPDAEEGARLQRERQEDERKDREWAERHYPVAGGAVVMRFEEGQHLSEREGPSRTSAADGGG